MIFLNKKSFLSDKKPHYTSYIVLQKSKTLFKKFQATQTSANKISAIKFNFLKITITPKRLRNTR